MKHVHLGGGIQLINNEVKVKLKKLTPEAVVPVYQSTGAAGFDFHSVENVIIMPGETELVSTGLAMEIPEGFELQVRPRSGMSAKTNIRVANSPGTIDCDYRGEIKIILHNTGTRVYQISIGDRVAQGVLAPVYQAKFEVVEELGVTERGENGFGSSGK